MNEGVAIAFAVIFALVSLIGLVLFKEARTHRFWRQLVAENNVEAIRGIMQGEIERWRIQRPPKGIGAAVWAGVQGMELITANAKYVHLMTSAEPEFRLVDGKPSQVATSLDTARATTALLLEMVFYDVPNFRPHVTRVDIYTAFRDGSGSALPTPILSVTAERDDAMYVDWDAEPRVVIDEFRSIYTLNETGEAQAIMLPAEDPALAEPEPAPIERPAQTLTEAPTEATTESSGEASSDN